MKPPAWINQLFREGSVAFSQISQASRTLFEQLSALNLLETESQGSRRRVIVRDHAAFTAWMEKAYPETIPAPMSGRRATSIARTRRSKSGTSTHEVQPILLRWFSADPHLFWADLSRRCGIIGITTASLHTLIIPQPWTLLTVENWESFLALDYHPQEANIIAVFTGGNIAETTLHAIAAMQPAPARSMHFGDYDWTGLAIFRRIQAVLPQIKFYIPDDITALFQHFANHALIIGQPSLVAHVDDPAEVHRVIALITQYNAGLEQEIVTPPSL